MVSGSVRSLDRCLLQVGLNAGNEVEADGVVGQHSKRAEAVHDDADTPPVAGGEKEGESGRGCAAVVLSATHLDDAVLLVALKQTLGLA